MYVSAPGKIGVPLFTNWSGICRYLIFGRQSQFLLFFGGQGGIFLQTYSTLWEFLLKKQDKKSLNATFLAAPFLSRGRPCCFPFVTIPLFVPTSKCVSKNISKCISIFVFLDELNFSQMFYYCGAITNIKFNNTDKN